MTYRNTWLGGSLLVAILSACAGLMGVEEPSLVSGPGGDPADGAPADSSAVVTPSGESDTGCAGPDCPCTTTPDSCPFGSYCLPTNVCAPGCRDHAGCVALTGGLTPYCNLTRHQCVACRAQADCVGPDQECTPSGVCANRCVDGGTNCKVTEKCCGGVCIDVRTDIFNCSDCGVACAGGSTICCAGQCKNPLSDIDHCGKCGERCSTVNGTPTACSAGSCRWSCNPGFSHCRGSSNSGCETMTSTSVTQCGSCSHDCNSAVVNATGIACRNSQCTFQSCTGTAGDCDEQLGNGCECECGKTDGATCCPSDSCAAGLRCGGDKRCHPCQAFNGPCSSSDQCCSDNCNTGASKCK